MRNLTQIIDFTTLTSTLHELNLKMIICKKNINNFYHFKGLIRKKSKIEQMNISLS